MSCFLILFALTLAADGSTRGAFRLTCKSSETAANRGIHIFGHHHRPIRNSIQHVHTKRCSAEGDSEKSRSSPPVANDLCCSFCKRSKHKPSRLSKRSAKHRLRSMPKDVTLGSISLLRMNWVICRRTPMSTKAWERCMLSHTRYGRCCLD